MDSTIDSCILARMQPWWQATEQSAWKFLMTSIRQWFSFPMAAVGWQSAFRLQSRR
jgi:hypothetical protein